MNKREICRNLKDVLVKIISLDTDGRVVSQGTGVFIDEAGLILTANHVIKKSPLASQRRLIAIRFRGGPPLPLDVKFENLELIIPEQDSLKPLQLDLAIVASLSAGTYPFVELEDDIPTEGTDVIMAGFPEDLKPPLNFSDAINFDKPELKANEQKFREFTFSRITWLMFKQGIVGGVFPIHIRKTRFHILDSEVTLSIEAAEYWIDNSSARSASGGPVVNMSGKLIGIITETTETNASDLTGSLSFAVPSGSTRALSHKLITWATSHLKDKLKAIRSESSAHGS